MWSDVFSEQADRQSLEVIAHAMQERISNGELSSYDHLLTTLCHARHRAGVQLLSNLVERPEQIPAETLAPQAPLHTRKPKLSVKNVTIAFGIACGAMLVDTIVSPLAGLLTAAAGGALWALYSARREEKERAKDGSQIIEHFAKAQEAFFSSNPHAHFAERLYHKLSERAPFSATARALKQRMDDTPRYAHLRDAT
jgi:hypothetical protein